MDAPAPPVTSSHNGPDAADSPPVPDVFLRRSKYHVTRIDPPEEPLRILQEWNQMDEEDKFLYHAYPCLPDFYQSLFGERVLCSLELPNSPQALELSKLTASHSDDSSDSVVVSQGRNGAIMQGYLDKRPLYKGPNETFVTSAFKVYKRRFFVLKNQQLVYYKAPPLNEHTKEVGKWSLTGASIILLDKDYIQLKINNDTKVYSLRGVEGVNMKDWYDLLCSETNIKASQTHTNSASAVSPSARTKEPSVSSASPALPSRVPRVASFTAAAISRSRSRRSESLSQILSQSTGISNPAGSTVLTQILSSYQRFFEDIDVDCPITPLLSSVQEPSCNPIRIIIKPLELSFKFFRDNSESFYFRMAIYDFDRRLKVTEDFTYMISQNGAQSQVDHISDMAEWTKLNSINEGADLNFELPNIGSNDRTARDSQRGVFSLSRLSPGLHVVVWMSKQLQEHSAKLAQPYMISRELTESEKVSFKKKSLDRKKEWSPAFHQTFVWGCFPLFEKHPKLNDHFQLMPCNTRKIERFYRVHGDVQNPFDIFKQMEYVLHPGSFAILPELMKEVIHISANFEILMPPKDVVFPTIGPDLKLRHVQWAGDESLPGLGPLHSEICGGLIPRQVMEFNQFAPPSEHSTFVYIYPKALNLMSSVTEFDMNVVLKITFKRDDNNTNEGDPAGSFFISRAWEADWKFFTLADTMVKCIQPLFHDELKALLPFPFKRGDHFLFSFYKVNLIKSSWFSSKTVQPKTFPTKGIPFHPDTFSCTPIGHSIVPIVKLFSSSSSTASAIVSEDVLCDIGELPLYRELQPGYLSMLEGSDQPLSVVEQCMFSLSFRIVSPWCSLDSDIIKFFGMTSVDMFLRKRFDWMPEVSSSLRDNLAEKQNIHILLLSYYSRKSNPLEACKLFPVLMDSLLRNLFDLFSSSRPDPNLHSDPSSNSFDANEFLAQALNVLRPFQLLPKSCTGRGAAFAKGVVDQEVLSTHLPQTAVRKDSEEKLTVLGQILATDCKRQIMTSQCWEIMFSCVHLIQKTSQIREGVAYKNTQGHDLLGRQYLRTHFNLPANPLGAKACVASFSNMILFSLVSSIEYVIDRKKAEPSILPLSEEIKADKPVFASNWFSLPPNITVSAASSKPNDVAVVSAMNMIAQSWFWLGSVLKSMVLLFDQQGSSHSSPHAFFGQNQTLDLIELLVISSSKFLSCITTCNMQRNFKDSGNEENDMVCLIDEIELKDLANSLNDSLVRFLLDLFPVLDTDFVNGCLDCYMDYQFLRKVNQEKLLQKADLRLRLDSIERIVSFRMLFQYTKTQKLPSTIIFEDIKVASHILFPLTSLIMKEVEFYVLLKMEDIEASCLARLCSLLLRLATSVTGDVRYQQDEIQSVIAHSLISIVPIMIDCEKNGNFFGSNIPESIPDGCRNENILVIVMFQVIEMFGFSAFASLFTTAKSDSVAAFCSLLIRFLRVTNSAEPIPSQANGSSPSMIVSEDSDSFSIFAGFAHKRVLDLLQNMVVAKQWDDSDSDHGHFYHIWTVLMEILECSTEELSVSLQFLQMMVGSVESPGPARAMFFGSVRNLSSSDGSSYACARWNEAVGHLTRLAFVLDISEAHDESNHTRPSHPQLSFMTSYKAISLLAQETLNVFVAPYENVEVPHPAVPEDYVAPDLTFIDDSPATSLPEEVKSMTPAAIILSLSPFKSLPNTLLDEVLVTYRSYCQPLYFLHQLIERYRRLSELRDADKQQAVAVCQARVINNLSKWVKEYFHDMRPSPPLTSRLVVFLIGVHKISKEVKVSKLLCKELLNKQSQRTSSSSETAGWPVPIMPAIPQASVFRFLLPTKKVENQAVDVVLHWHPKEIARQMSLIESSFFKVIQASEFMNQNWAKRPHLAPNIKLSQDRFNLVARWVAWQILQRNTVEERATVVEKFYEIALHLRELQNYNSCLEITSGLANAGVFRLKKTLALVKERDESRVARGEKWSAEAVSGLIEAYEALKVDMAQTGNYKKMRDIMNSDGGPLHNGIQYCGIVPYLGIFLSDFTFLDEGSQTFSSPGLVNLKKVKLFSSQIKKIKEWQAKSYSLHVVPQLRDSLINLVKPMFDVDSKEEKALYDRSLEVEPREAAGTAQS